MILAGDVGGTKTHLALFEVREGRPRRLRDAVFDSRAGDGLEPMVRAFAGRAAGEGPIAGACFGVAGPVAGDRAELPNLSWTVDAERLAAALALPRVVLINDLVATAYGIPLLGEAELVPLAEGEAEPGGTRAVIAAGTGLGMAAFVATGNDLTVIASEGGHGDFAPRDEPEIGLFRFLTRRFGHVSVERVVSGPGIAALYEYLRQSGYAPEEAAMASALERAADPPAAIAEAALAGRSPLAVKALDMFVAAYGAAAGNLALITLATGGVYLAGGIPPKILPKLEDGTFLAAFRDKGRYAPLMARIPVRVVLEPATALLGAAWRGAREAGLC